MLYQPAITCSKLTNLHNNNSYRHLLRAASDIGYSSNTAYVFISMALVIFGREIRGVMLLCNLYVKLTLKIVYIKLRNGDWLKLHSLRETKYDLLLLPPTHMKFLLIWSLNNNSNNSNKSNNNNKYHSSGMKVASKRDKLHFSDLQYIYKCIQYMPHTYILPLTEIWRSVTNGP